MNKFKVKISVFNLFKKLIGLRLSTYFLFRLKVPLIRKEQLIFIHIPKVAGTSIAKALYGKRVGHFSIVDYKKILKEKEYTSFPSFSVVRNPFDRLISAYLYATQGGTKDGGINNPELYITHPFRTFNSFVNEWLIFQDLHNIELVFRPQYLFITSPKEPSKILVDKVFKLNNVLEIEAYLESYMGKPIQLENKNKSVRENAIVAFYDEKTKRIVASLYEEDFELFNYDPNKI